MLPEDVGHCFVTWVSRTLTLPWSIIIIMIRQFIRRRNMSMKSLQGRRQYVVAHVCCLHLTDGCYLTPPFSIYTCAVLY